MKSPHRVLNNTVLKGSVGVLALAFSSQAFAGGFEKATMFSGHYAPMAGAAASIVGGSESLYFNPAGLAAGAGKIELSLNLSPTFSQFKGPIATTTQLEGSTIFSPVYGVFASYKVSDKLGIGIGSAAVGGAKAEYDDVDFSGFSSNTAAITSLKPTIKTDLTLLEHSIGAAYELIDGLRLGFSWRISQVKANFSSASVVGGVNLVAVDLTDLTATRYNGWRLGLQYAPKDSPWGFGVNWRTAVNFIAKGTVSGKAENALPTTTTPADLTGGPAEVSNEFPNQISIGGFYWVSPKTFRTMLEYTFTQYAVNRAIDINAPFTIPTGAIIIAAPATTNPVAVNSSVSDIQQSWKNQHNARIGFEYLGMETWALRAGYILTTAVTPADHARATFSTPGVANQVMLGAGKTLMNGNLGINGGLEYSFGSNAGTNEFGKAGDFSTTAYAAHLGVTYSM